MCVCLSFRCDIRSHELVNSHPVKVPHMAPLVMHYELSFNRSRGFSSGIVGVPSQARRGFESVCNTFFIFGLASIPDIPT